MSIFNEDQIRQAIDRFQETHPVSFAFDIHHIKDEESLDILKRTIDDLCKKAEQDSEMHIICEMAKAYLDGAKPSFNKETLKRIKLTRDEFHTRRIIEGFLDERTMMIYGNQISVDEAIALGWNIEKIE